MKIKTLFPLNLRVPARLAASTFAAAGCLFFVASAWATDYTSTNSGNWSTPATWSPNGTPGAGDTATIAGGTTVTLTANTTCSGVTNDSGGVLDESGSAYNLSIAGNFVNNGTFKAGYSAPMVSFTTTGTTTATYQVTPGVTALTVECWGGGGAGGSVHVSSGSYGAGGGGAGGCFSKTQLLSLAGGSSYAVQVGGGGAPVAAATGNVGSNSFFGSVTMAMAAGGGGGVGQSAYDATGGGGSVGTGSTGTVYLGGAGAGGVSSNHHGGGGGAGAGLLGAGSSGYLSVGGTNTAGLGGGVNGGNGGNGAGSAGNAGAAGSTLGGGGGGGFGSSTAKDSSGGAGAPGQVVLIWPVAPVNATKANNTDNLNLTTSWTGGAVPSATGIATWDSTVTGANTVALGAGLAFGGITIANPSGLVTISADGNTLTNNGPINLSAATADLTLDCALALGAANTWTVTNTHTLTVGGVISGAFGLTNEGAGTVILSGANTYTGTTTVGAGILSLGNSLALQNSVLNTDGSITGDANNGLQTTVTSLTLGGLSGSKNFAASGGVFTATGGGYNGVTALTLNLGAGTNLSYSGSIADGATGMTLTKTGAGTLNLYGANTYSGATTVGGGNLILNNLSAIADSSSVSLLSGATIEPILAGTYANTAPLSLAGTGTAGLSEAGALYFGNAGFATTIWNTPLILGGATRISSYGVTMDQTLGGAIGGTGPLTIASRGGANTHTAVWTLNAASTYTGNTVIDNDNGLLDVTVMLGVANALPATTSLNLYGATTMIGSIYATLDLNGNSQTLAGLTDTNSSSLNGSGTFGTRVINSSATPATLTLNIASGTDTFGTPGTRVIAGTIGGTTAGLVAANNLGLTVTGGGTLILAGANTYTGATTITNGTLLVNGSTAAASAVTVASGGTLGGTGTIGGTVNVASGGTLAPGGGYTTFTLNGNLTLSTGSTNSFEVNGSTPANDVIMLGGNVTYGGVLNIITNGTFTLNQAFPLFSGAGAVSGSSFTRIAGSPGVGLAFAFTNGVLSVVPAIVGPTLTSVTPSPVTGSSYPVTLGLTGSGFTGATAVLLTNLSTSAGTTINSPTVNSDSSISVSFVPGTAASSWNATVINGAPSSQVPFAVTAPAVVKINSGALKSAGAGNVMLSGIGGVPGNSYAVESATNLPQAVWLPVVTNQFDGSGNFNYTNPVTPGTSKLFLRIQQ